jgi:hypothetical protein
MRRVEDFCSTWGETGRVKGGTKREGKMERREGVFTNILLKVKKLLLLARRGEGTVEEGASTRCEERLL